MEIVPGAGKVLNGSPIEKHNVPRTINLRMLDVGCAKYIFPPREFTHKFICHVP